MSKKNHFVLGFFLGAAVSSAATWLLTPETGSDLKQKLAHKKDDIANRAADYYDYAREATAEWRDSASQFVSDLKEQKHQDGDLADYDAQTQALKDELTDVPEVASDEEFDDIVLDGKSAFAQAKDSEPIAQAAAIANEIEAAKSDVPVEPETASDVLKDDQSTNE